MIINSELTYNKKYLKAEERNTKIGFQCFNTGNTSIKPIPVILIDSVHIKDENYYTKVFLEKYYVF